MKAQQQKLYSEEEYLELERKADYKSGYYRGEIFRLGDVKLNHYSEINHNTIVTVVFLL